MLRYADRAPRPAPRHAAGRATAASTRLEGFLLAGDTSAEAWIKPLLQDELPAQAYGRLLLRPGAKAPVAVQSRGKQVCTCFDVSETEIDGRAGRPAAGAGGQRLAALQAELQVRHQLRLLPARTQAHGARSCRRWHVRTAARQMASSMPFAGTIAAMGISQYIKEIGRGKQGARSLDP